MATRQDETSVNYLSHSCSSLY